MRTSEAGKNNCENGGMNIKIKTEPNDSINETFFENYLLQISIPLDANKWSNINAEGATVANAGKNKVLNYTILPKKSGNISFKAEVTDFSMDEITISAVPFSMAFEKPDTSKMTGDMDLLVDAIEQLNEGVLTLKDGTLKMNNGTLSLKKGSEGFEKGIKQISSKSGELINGSKMISNALNQIVISLNGSLKGNDMSKLNALPDGLNQFSDGLKKLSGGMLVLNQNYKKANTALSNAINEIPDNEIAPEDIGKLVMENPENNTVNQLIENYKAARKVKGVYQNVFEAFKEVEISKMR